MDAYKKAHKRTGKRLIEQTYNLKTGKITKRSKVVSYWETSNKARLVIAAITLVLAIILGVNIWTK